MTRWEYRELVTADIARGFDIATLNSLGDEGWELIAIHTRQGGIQVLVAVFKRPRAEVSDAK